MARGLPTIYLRGTFRIEDADGCRVPLRSMKAQGLLALLATSPKAERSRPWLQSKLWSDRGADQASGSMRQALTQLRKVLTPVGIVLETDRRRIALDLETVRIETGGTGDLVEGLDVRDGEFETWLTVERSRQDSAAETVAPAAPALLSAPPRSQSRQWSMTVAARSAPGDETRIFEDVLADAVARSLRETYAAPIHVGAADLVTDWLLVASVQVFAVRPEGMAVRITIDHPATNHQVWSGFRDLNQVGSYPVSHPDLRQLVNEMIEAVGDYLIVNGVEQLDPNDPDKISRLAVRALFSMDPTRLLQADALFGQAHEARHRGLYLAWRAQLRAIQIIEKHPVDVAALKEEGRDFHVRALELEPNNSMVLATLANALRIFDRDDAHSYFLAERAVRLNPANSLAWWSLSAAGGYAGDTDMAYRDALTGRQLALLSPHRFWWDSQVYNTAMLSGRLAEALAFAEAAHAANPEFRPPLRYLVALHANAGNVEQALRAAEKLKHLEPDFSIERLLNDRDYPASLIRRTPGLDTARIATLI